MRPFRHLNSLIQSAALIVFASVSLFGQASNINVFAGFQALGAGYTGNAGPAAAAQMDTPDGIAVDGSGNVYIADFSNSVVRLVSNGVISTAVGLGGTPGYSGDGGLPKNALLRGPLGLAIDSAGNLYIADGPSNAIRKVSNGQISTIAGGTAGFSGDGGAATAASLNYPAAVAVDSAGNLYIADAANHRIRKVSQGIITTVAGTGQLGFNGDNVAATFAQLFLPKGIAVDPQGNLYIADTGNNLIRKVSAGVITTIAGTGSAGYSGDKGPAASAVLNAPSGVTVDSAGNVYVADTGNNVIRKIAGGIITTVAGTGVAGYGGDGGSALTALLKAPAAVALDVTGGSTYIVDTGNNVVRVITNSVVTGVVPHFAAGGSYVTGFYVINKTNQTAGFTMTFNDNTGTPVAVPIKGQSAGTSIVDVIAPFGTGYYEIGNIADANGSSGSVVIQSNPGIVVQALIRHLSAANVFYEASVPATTGAFEVQLAFDATTFTTTGAQIYTGVGLANMDLVSPATITCTAKDNLGTVIPNAIPVLTVAPLGHAAGYNFPALVGKRGTIDCSSSTKMGVIALRFLGNDAISTLPILTVR